tara:strand:- start:190 stop:519 length:330 start_codon:yes stop_codon:yes gene_type:complete
METALKRKVVYETKTHDFDAFIYVENWENARLRDSFFVYAGGLYQDGSVRKGETKYFYSPYSAEAIEKEVNKIDVHTFKWFDKLYYLNGDGEVMRIDGTPAWKCDYTKG